MRVRAVAVAAICVGLGLGSAASARLWTDPAGNLTVDAPSGWTVQPERIDNGTLVMAFNPSSDCYLMSIPNPASASASVGAVQRSTAQLSTDAWSQASNIVRDFAGAQVVSQSVDTSGFWPVQRAQLRAGDRTIYGAIEVRPGFELRGFCTGPDASYDAILNSIGHPNDATWEATPPPPAAPAPAPTPQ